MLDHLLRTLVRSGRFPGRFSDDVNESDGHDEEGDRTRYRQTVEILLHHPAPAERSRPPERGRQTCIFPRVEKDKQQYS